MTTIRRHRLVLALCLAIASALAACRTPSANAGNAKRPELVELIKVVPDIQLDIRYATTNNFTHHAVYPVARCFLIKKAALALKKVQADLRRQGLGLKVFDGYRPLSVQWKFWDLVPDSRYVADPHIGSRHNRGYAVDVTLVDQNGKDLPMPTGYDDFSERAHRDYMNLPREAIRNRKLLERVMVKHGFVPFATEWWHFDFHGYENKPNLDVPLEDL